jgi:hypothetical protein
MAAFTLTGSRLEGPRSTEILGPLKRVQHEVLLHSPVQKSGSIVGRNSRHLREIQKKTDQNYPTETVKKTTGKNEMTRKPEF